jgi:hypothetical protein
MVSFRIKTRNAFGWAPSWSSFVYVTVPTVPNKLQPVTFYFENEKTVVLRWFIS